MKVLWISQKSLNYFIFTDKHFQTKGTKISKYFKLHSSNFNFELQQALHKTNFDWLEHNRKAISYCLQWGPCVVDSTSSNSCRFIDLLKQGQLINKTVNKFLNKNFILFNAIYLPFAQPSIFLIHFSHLGPNARFDHCDCASMHEARM